MVAVGSTVPAPPKSLWEKSDGNSVVFPTSGKYIIVGVPGAFTRLSPPISNICFQQSSDTIPLYVAPCSSQVPGYIANYDGFAAKGVSDIYIVAVNDIVSTLINILSVSLYLGQYN